MPKIHPSADLRNKYNEISEFCHTHPEPVFITKNGRGDLVVMSIETYEMLLGNTDLYRLIDDGLSDIARKNTRPMNDVLDSLRGTP